MKFLRIPELKEDSEIKVESIMCLNRILLEESNFHIYYDLKIDDIKSFYLRNFFYIDDKFFLLTILSLIPESYDSEDGLSKQSIFTENEELLSSLSMKRLEMMINFAEVSNISIFSVFHEWLLSCAELNNVNWEQSSLHVKEAPTKLKEAVDFTLSEYEDDEVNDDCFDEDLEEE